MTENSDEKNPGSNPKKPPAKEGEGVATGGKESSGTETEETPKEKRQGISGGLVVIFVIIILGATVLFFKFRGGKEPPPPSMKTATTNATEDFYQAYQKGLGPLVKARLLFFQGRTLMGGTSETLPESSKTAESGPQSPLFRAAENFALATESLDHAEGFLHTDTVRLKAEEKPCRESLEDAYKKYRESVRIFNEYARTQYQGGEAKSEKFALGDGAAKWEMAETLMAELLHDGCKGQFFVWVQKQKPETRAEAFEGYRAFYGPSFEAQRTEFSRLMNTEGGGPAAHPQPIPESYPTKVFLNRPPQ